MDQGILRAMVDSIGRLEARAGENAYALERLRRAARISDWPGTVVRQTTRLRFLSLAGVQIARELAKIVPAPNVRDLRGPHKAATAIAVEILNIVYGPILDRPLTIEDLKSRESYRRSKT